MQGAVPTWVATTIGVMAGGSLTMMSNWIADKRLSERERESRREERRARLEARRNEFQRETLLALQVASQKLLRTTGAMLHQDVMAFRQTGHWQRQQFADDLSNEHLRQLTETMLLASRIRDDEARELANRLRSYVAVVCSAADRDTAETRMSKAGDTQQSLLERTGQLIRALDDEN